MEIIVHVFGITTLLARGKATKKLDLLVQMSIIKLCCYLCNCKLCCNYITLSPTLTLQALLLKTVSKFKDSEVSLLGLIFVRPSYQAWMNPGSSWEGQNGSDIKSLLFHYIKQSLERMMLCSVWKGDKR